MFSSYSRHPSRISFFFCLELMVLFGLIVLDISLFFFQCSQRKEKNLYLCKMFSFESWLFQIFIFYSHTSIVHVSLNEIMKPAWLVI